jgi:hypothetical protein
MGRKQNQALEMIGRTFSGITGLLLITSIAQARADPKMICLRMILCLSIPSLKINTLQILLRWCSVIQCTYIPATMKRQRDRRDMMSEWLCFASADMIHWKEYPSPLNVKDFTLGKG